MVHGASGLPRPVRNRLAGKDCTRGTHIMGPGRAIELTRMAGRRSILPCSAVCLFSCVASAMDQVDLMPPRQERRLIHNPASTERLMQEPRPKRPCKHDNRDGLKRHLRTCYHEINAVRTLCPESLTDRMVLCAGGADCKQFSQTTTNLGKEASVKRGVNPVMAKKGE
jgi:hypothetical protein